MEPLVRDPIRRNNLGGGGGGGAPPIFVARLEGYRVIELEVIELELELIAYCIHALGPNP